MKAWLNLTDSFCPSCDRRGTLYMDPIKPAPRPYHLTDDFGERVGIRIEVHHLKCRSCNHTMRYHTEVNENE